MVINPAPRTAAHESNTTALEQDERWANERKASEANRFAKINPTRRTAAHDATGDNSYGEEE